MQLQYRGCPIVRRDDIPRGWLGFYNEKTMEVEWINIKTGEIKKGGYWENQSVDTSKKTDRTKLKPAGTYKGNASWDEEDPPKTDNNFFDFPQSEQERIMQKAGFLAQWDQNELLSKQPETETEGLLSDCCRSEFDPFGFEREDGLWQEKCLKCGKKCDPRHYEPRNYEPQLAGEWEEEYDKPTFWFDLLPTQKAGIKVFIRKLVTAAEKRGREEVETLEVKAFISQVEAAAVQRGREEVEKDILETWLFALQQIQGSLSRVGKEKNDEGRIISALDHTKFLLSQHIGACQRAINTLTPTQPESLK